jgi:hypothetical protein
LYDSYQAAGLSAAVLERGLYTRIKQIQKLMNSGTLDSSLRWIPQRVEAVVA